MPLPFNTQQALETDLVSKPGIYATDIIIGKPDTSLNGFTTYDLSVIKEVVEPDGTKRYIKSTQSIVEDLSDNSFGYGNNKQWGEFDRSATTFTDEVNERADNFEGNTLPSGQTVVKVTVSNIDEARRAAIATAYLDDGSTISALLYKDSQDTWKRQIL